MTARTTSIITIVSIFLLLLYIGITWWSANQDAKLRETLARTEGELIQLKASDSIKTIDNLRLKHIADSAFKLVRIDTITIVRNYETKINNVRNLNTDNSILFFATKISQIDSFR